MNTTEIRELTDADLDIVSGGWKRCETARRRAVARGSILITPTAPMERRSITSMPFLREFEQGKAKGKGGSPK